MTAWLALLLACAPEPAAPDPRVVDQRLYQRALLAPSPQEALALCEQIQDIPTRGECVVFEAGALIRAGGDGYSACGRLPHVGWQQVCFFELVDAGKMKGDRALAACQQTGPFMQRCLSHALQREESRLAREFAAGQEAALQAHIRGLLEPYGITDQSDEALDVTITGRVIARRLPARHQPFSRSVCGSADDRACAEAYRVLVLQAGGQGKAPPSCESPVQRDQVAAMGLPVWADDAQPLADAVWAHLCRRANTAQHHRPDAGNAGRGR